MRFRQRPGMELIMVVVLVSVLATIGLAVLTLVNTEARQSRRLTIRQQVFNVAEAGVSYYRWHLAHYPSDYQDGTGAAGPYVHDFTDATGATVGRYELTITPPPNGSGITTVQSTGYLISVPNTKKTVVARLGIPSLTKYAVVSASDLRFGLGTEIFGPIHSNGGIRFDGLAHGLITSAKQTYDDPDHSGGNEIGVHTHANIPPTSVNESFRSAESDPANIPNRSDVFAGGRQSPAAPIDFNGITADLATLKSKAESPSGIYLGASGAQGYHVVLKTTGRLDISVVNTQLQCQFRSGSGTCSNDASRPCSGINTGCSGSGTCLNWRNFGYCAANFNRACTADSSCRTCTNDPTIFCSNNSTCQDQGAGNCEAATAGACQLSSFSIGNSAGSETPAIFGGQPAANILMPANGVIFLGDDVWVDGQINNARLTIVAAEGNLSTGTANIFINKDLTYTPPYDGTDAIGLIAQNNILTGYFSQYNITIDAAMIAQKGRIGRPYYGSAFTSSSNNAYYQTVGGSLPNGGGSETSCKDFRMRRSLTSKGSLATNQRYGFAWVGNTFNCPIGDDNDSGYCGRTLDFDANMTYAPPPEFPTTGEYQIISFDEQ